MYEKESSCLGYYAVSLS